MTGLPAPCARWWWPEAHIHAHGGIASWRSAVSEVLDQRGGGGASSGEGRGAGPSFVET